MNVYQEVQSLQKSPVETGGLCSLAYFKIEDVLVWPKIDPVTGTIINSIQMKPGKSIYICQTADKGRQYDEEKKDGDGGPFIDTQVTGTLAGGHNTANILSLDAMKYHQWGVIGADRGGFYRLVGSADAGAILTWKYTSADSSGTRKVQLQWNWENPNSAPVYQSQLFKITIGTVTITTGKLTLIIRFRVGDPLAPMDGSDTTLTNAGFANKNLLVLADGTALSCDDGSGAIDWGSLIIRHYEKTLAGNMITFVGGVNNEEIIEIYAFE